MKSKLLKEELVNFLEFLKSENLRTSKKTNLKYERKAKELLFQYISTLRIEAYNGIPNSQFELALCYDDGLLGNKLTKYKYWIEKAAKNNHPAACNIYGWIIESENPKNQSAIKKALKWYKLSADLGDTFGKKNYKMALKQISKMK